MQAIQEFFGRFHPLLVHLPIGILMIAVLFELLTVRYERFGGLKPALPLLYLFGGLGAIGACLTGYVLSLSGDYGGDLLVRHQWSGILTAVLGLLIYYLHQQKKAMPILSVGLLIVLSVAGHFGGSLTHGSDYLMAPLRGETEAVKIEVANPPEALVYEELVVPIFSESCYPCHNAQKQKGKLRLDSPEFIAEGGKSGKPMIVADAPGQSEILQRIQLPESDDDHMPPNEKYALREDYKAILVWWLKQGGSYEAKVKDLGGNEEILTLLENLRTETPPESAYPEVDLPAPDPEAVRALQDLRAGVIPIAEHSSLLEISLINVDSINSTLMEALQALAPHIAWLRCSDQPFKSEHLATFTSFEHLTKLYLNDTQVGDEGLAYLSQLPSLSYLNLKGTPVTAQGLEKLAAAPALQHLFIYQTATNAAERKALALKLSEVSIDTGGYRVPTLRTDTTMLE
ncbi:MAG TPA: c-type cytochrome domain-containing protein [Saprospiraceae bacterium]|nr:c-type cytochrome domain-containing protein [Saprospiraceae bacterium]